MKCPKCGAHVDPHVKHCHQCGGDLLELFEKRAWSGFRRWKKRRRFVPPLWVLPALCASMLLIAVGSIMVIESPANPGAFWDPQARVAFVAPEGWNLSTSGLGEGWRFRHVARLTCGRAVIEVDVPLEGLPARNVLDHLGDLVRDDFKDRRPGVEPAIDVELDGLAGKSVRFEVAGGRGETIFVGGGRRHYLIRFYADQGEFDRRRRDWQVFLATLRFA